MKILGPFCLPCTRVIDLNAQCNPLNTKMENLKAEIDGLTHQIGKLEVNVVSLVRLIVVPVRIVQIVEKLFCCWQDSCLINWRVWFAGY